MTMEEALEAWGGRGNANAGFFRTGWRRAANGHPADPPEERWAAMAYQAGYDARAGKGA